MQIFSRKSKPRILTATLLAMMITATATAQDYLLHPELIDSIQLEDYRRIWGSPDGAFFLQKGSGIEIRKYPNTDNRTISYRTNQKLITSERGNHYALVTYSSLTPTQLQITAISLYDYSGKEVWTARDPGCNTFILCDNAPVAVGISGAEGLAESRLSFFNSSGAMTGVTKVENFYNGKFSDNGEYFFGIVGAGTLSRFASSGTQMQTYGEAYQYFTSYDGSLVTVISDTLAKIYSKSDTLISWKIGTRSVRDVRFSRDNRFAAILFVDKFAVYDLGLASMIAEYTLDDSAYRFFHFDADPNFAYFVCGASNSADSPEFKNTKGMVLLLGAGGELLWGENVTYEDWSVRYPDVHIDTINRVVTLLTSSILQVYRF